jgi:hypothetical protein
MTLQHSLRSILLPTPDTFNNPVQEMDKSPTRRRQGQAGQGATQVLLAIKHRARRAASGDPTDGNDRDGAAEEGAEALVY